MSSWELKKLSEVADIIGGATPKSDVDEYFNGDIPWITPKDLSGYKNRYISKGERNITKLGLENSSAKLLPKGAVLFTSRAPIGYVAIADNEVSTNQGFKSLVLKDGNIPEFFYYLLKHNIPLFEARATGSTFKEVSGQVVKNTELLIPSIDIQKKIVDLVSPLDEKIQLNTQINQTLEQIAQTIFKSWFIDFDPVHAKANALASGQTAEQATQAAMAVISGKNTQELHRLQTANPEQYQQLWEIAEAFPRGFDEEGVPWGWDSKKVGEVAKIVKGKSYKSSELAPSKTALVTLKSFNRGGGYRLDGLKEYTGNYKEEQEVFAGDLIIAYTDVTQAADVIGKPAMVMSDSCYEHLVISLDVGVVRPKNEKHKYFLYCLAMTDTFQAHTHSFCTGTTVLHLGKDAVPSFEFILPDNKFIELFDEFVLPIFVRINNIIEENKSLEKIRDELLPKLLSGEILNGN
ncbi:restriction endonuclease subunit S [Glaesserella parasuis]|uniref:restriction endonuclease subunit S n=1 Tax=Glaesserella parasuis TaxID=738 RepID=UPI002436CFD8|nr:restriction endonuclease subunit S [Glaesserella parasuis]MDG6805051.1 restriction endonuclease subunit S [Glaesserella parasuis]